MSESPRRHRAAATATPPVALPPSGARVTTFANGLELILKLDPSAPVASLQAWVRTGSIHEGAHRGAGVSHLVEHLVFKGTSSRDANRIARDVQDTGGYINAFTSFDRTVYWVDTPRDGVPVALAVLAELVHAATFPEDDFEREKDVIRKEIAMGNDDPGRVSSRLLFSTVFRDHPFGEPVIGHLELFDRVGRNDALGYYRARYIPNNIFFVVVGDVDASAVTAALGETLGKLPRAPLPHIPVPDEPPQLGRREERLPFETELSRFALSWRIPGVTHPDMPALDVLASVLGDGRSSRLFREVREERGLVHGIGAYAYTPSTEGVFSIYGDADPDKRAMAESAVLDIVGRLSADGPTGAEIEKARKGALADQLHALVTMRGQATDLASSWLLTRNLDFTRDYVEALGAVGADDVRDVARRYLVGRCLTATSLEPASAPGPAAAGGGGEPVFPAPPECFELANGLTVIVRDDPRLPLASVHGVFRAGLLAETPETAGLTQLCAATLLKGTARRTAAEIADAIEGVGGSVGASAGNNTLAVSVAVMAPDIALGLDVLGDVLKGATFAEPEVAREKAAQIAAIKRDDDHLLSYAFKRLRRGLFPGHPYAQARKGTAESVGSLGRGALVAFRDRYLCGRNGVVAIFGEIRASDARALAEEHLAGIPAGHPELGDPVRPAPREAGGEHTFPRPKQQAVLAVGFLTGGVLCDDRVVLDLIDEACSDMASRLFVRIREELGLAYYVSATQFLGLAGGAFVFYLGTAPDKLALAETELADEIAQLAAHGMAPDELARAKKTYLGKHEIALQSDAALAQTTALDQLFGFGFDHYQSLADTVEAISPERVKAVAARVFGPPAEIVRVVPQEKPDA